MATPSKIEIEKEALRNFMLHQAKGYEGIEDTLPERHELKEAGFLNSAKQSLMCSKTEQRLYDDYMDNVVNEPERVHASLQLCEILKDVKQCLGLCLVGESGHGKSYTAFSLVREAMKDPNMTVIILSPSTIWRRNFGYIKYVKAGTSVFNPIVPKEEVSLESVPFLRDTIHVNLDKKWIYEKSQWFENLVTSGQHLLFEIKYLNSRRIKSFESVVIQLIYHYQENAIETDPNYKHHFLVILEESQNSFGTYSMNSDDSLSLFTVFTQSRSDANLHFVCIGQRLNDISTKVVERLRLMIGLTLGENSLRKIKSQLPEHLKTRVQELPKRHWIYLDGKSNPEIVVPEFKTEGIPTQCLPFEMPDPLVLECTNNNQGFFKKWFNR